MSNPTSGKAWMQSHSGRVVTPLDLLPEQVTIEDVAVSLSRRNRFSGQTLAPYSVAQHCVEGSNLIAGPYKLAFLLHELGEVFLPDIPSPLKPFVHICADDVPPMPWHALEIQHTNAILVALGLISLEPLLYAQEVKTMDLAMLSWEKNHLMGPEPEPWGLTVPPAADYQISCWPAESARLLFLQTFQKLTSK